MKLTVERLPESQVRLDIVADEPEFNQAVEKAARKVMRDVQLPGFRKGKAPRSMIERLYGREVFLEEAHRIIMDDLYRQAIQQEELVPVGQPEVEITEPDPIAFTVTVPVYPTIEPGDYTSVRVETQDAAVDEAGVDEVIERLRKTSSPWVDPAEPRTPREGDQVTLDLAMFEDEEPYGDSIEDAVFVIGESQLFEKLRELVETLEVGQQGSTEISFAEDDEDAAERLRGKTLTYQVTLKGFKERDLLDVDDDFAKTSAGEETVESLRLAILRDLHQGKTAEIRNAVVSEIIDKIAEGANIELPAVMVDDAVEEEIARVRQRLQMQRSSLEAYLRAQDQTEEELKEELRPNIAKRLRNSLVLREIADREGITVSDEDIEAEIETIVSGAPNPEQMRQVYGGDRYMRSILRNDLYDQRLTDRLIAIATEGRGAVTNAYEASLYPEPQQPAAAEGESFEPTAGVAESGDGFPEDVDSAPELDESATTGASAEPMEELAEVAAEEDEADAAESDPAALPQEGAEPGTIGE